MTLVRSLLRRSDMKSHRVTLCKQAQHETIFNLMSESLAQQS